MFITYIKEKYESEWRREEFQNIFWQQGYERHLYNLTIYIIIISFISSKYRENTNRKCKFKVKIAHFLKYFNIDR